MENKEKQLKQLKEKRTIEVFKRIFKIPNSYEELDRRVKELEAEIGIKNN